MKTLSERIRELTAVLTVVAIWLNPSHADQSACSAPLNPAFQKWVNEAKASSTLPRQALKSSQGNALGLRPSPLDRSYLSHLQATNASFLAWREKLQYASKYDLRNYGYLTSVKNQNPYGTCWAHAACGAIESALLKSGQGVYDFSENNMVNLHGFDWGFDGGGNGDIASAYLLRWDGPVLENEDSYPNIGSSRRKPPARHVQNIRWIPGRTSARDNDKIKQALLDYGAIDASYYHDGSCLSADGKSYYCNYTDDTNHAILIVGWDDNYSASNFVFAPPGNGAFIIKNSWGSSWGENGYFYISYYDTSLAYKTMYAFLTPERSTNYDAVYQYDALGCISSTGWSSYESGWGANIFVADRDENIAAVGFYALTPNTSYTIYIYTGAASNSPRSGTLAHSQSGSTDTAGYFTIPLSKSVAVRSGTRFSVVISLTTPGYNFPIAYEYAISGYSSAATASPGESFYSKTGTSWIDFTEYDVTANFCCKVYTVGIRPSNDDFANASSLSGVSGSVGISSRGATYEAGEPKHYYSTATNSVWWKWIPAKSGTASFSTAGSTFDTVLCIYKGATLSSLSKYAYNDDGTSGTTSECEFEVEAGTAYYIAVAGYGGRTGDVQLSWSLTPRIHTIVFNGNGGTVSGDGTRSVVSGDEIGTLPEATKPGYAFIGWYSGPQNGFEVDEDTIVTVNATLYARWKDAATVLNEIRDEIGGYGCGMSVSGNAPWVYDYEIGGLISGGISDDQESVLEMTVSGPGRITFDWKVISELNYDELIVSVDGTVVSSISGTTSWDDVDYWISGSGNHVVRWIYRKDSSLSRGDDCGFLKNISWSGAKITPRVAFDANGGVAEYTSALCEVGRWYDRYYPDVWREGYDLKGWFSARTGGLNAAGYRVQMYALTLYAQWQPVYSGSCATGAKRIYMGSGVSMIRNPLQPEWCRACQEYHYDYGVYYYRLKLQRGRKYTFAAPLADRFYLDGWVSDSYDYDDYDINWYEDGSLEYMVIDTTAMTVAERDFVIYIDGGYIGQNTTLYCAPGDLVPVGISGKPEVLPGDCSGEEISVSGSRSLNGGDYYFSTIAEPGVRYKLAVSGVNGIGISATGNWRTPGLFVLEPDSYVRTSSGATFVFSVEEQTNVRLRVNATNGGSAAFTAVWRRSSPTRATLSALGGNFEFSEDELYNDTNYPWFADYSQTLEGRPTFRSGVITNSMTTAFTAVISAEKLVPPETNLTPRLRFKCRTSSESGCDYFTYAFDDAVMAERISGETEWRSVSYDCSHWMDGENHEVTFRYRKDYSVDQGFDCAWITGLDIVWIADPEVFMRALTEDENTFGLDESAENLWIPDYRDGRICVRSPEINGTGSGSYAVYFDGAGKLAFDYMISCSRTGAKLTVSIDGREVSASGEVGWATYECIVGPGSHEIRWTYTKTAAPSAGDDCVWISSLRLTQVNCSLFFNANGGSCPQTSKRVVYGEEIGDMPIPRRSGFVFDGWYTAAVGGGQVFSNTIMSVSTDYTLFAHWKDFGAMADELRDILYLEGCEISLSGDAPWENGSLDTGMCRSPFTQSGEISDNQESILQVTVEGSGWIDFEWCVSSEEDYDLLEFIVDGAVVSAISGEMDILNDWEDVSYYIYGEGRHTIQWRYSKDYSESCGEDRGYLRNVDWSGREITSLVGFNPNGGQAEYSSAYCALGDRYEYYYPDAWREGYGLLGWFSAPQGGVDSKNYRVLKDPLTLYAHWQKVTVGSCYSAAKRLYMGSGVKSINTTLIPDWWYDDEQGGFVYDWDYGVYNYRIKLQRDRVYTFAASWGGYGFDVWDWNENLDVTWYSDDNLEYAVVDTHGIDTQEIEVIIDFWDGFVGESATLYYAPGDLVPIGISDRPENLPGDCNGEETSISGSRSLNRGDYYFSTEAEPGVRYELSVSGVNGIGISATGRRVLPGASASTLVLQPDSYVRTSSGATFVFSVEERMRVKLRVNATNGGSAVFTAVWRRSSPTRAMLSALGGNFEFSEDELYNDEHHPWFADYSQMLDGKPTLRSGVISNSMTTVFTAVISADKLVLPAADMTPKLRFKWKVSSESGFDYLRYALDGVSASGGISGTTQWQSVAVDISSWMDGYDHEISFTYSKDGSVSNGQDCGWIGGLEIVWISDPEVFMPALTSDDIFELYEQSENSWFPAVKDSRTCVRSPQIDGTGESSFTVNFTGAGKLLFDYRISCSQTGAKLQVNVDGRDISVSGEIPWSTYAVSLDYGEHIVTWTYEKTNASDSGADAAFISNLRFEPIVPPGSNQDLAVEIYPDNTIRIKDFILVPESCSGCSDGDSGVYYMKATLKKGEVYTFAVPKEISAFGYISGEAWRWFCCSDDGSCVAGECTTDYYEDAVYDYCVVDLRAGKYDSSIPNEFVYYIPIYGPVGYPTFMYYVKGDYASRPEPM